MLVTNAADYFFFLGIKTYFSQQMYLEKVRLPFGQLKVVKKCIWCLKILSNSADPAFIAIAYTVKFG